MDRQKYRQKNRQNDRQIDLRKENRRTDGWADGQTKLSVAQFMRISSLPFNAKIV